jgi:hypothetical protein
MLNLACVISALFLIPFSGLQGQVLPGTVNVNLPAGGFRIEGDLQANTPVAGIGDWVPVNPGQANWKEMLCS